MNTICTHDGRFHADEIMACTLLKLLPQYSNFKIIRTRVQNDIDACEIVIDVGAIYDPERKRFDHHQRSFIDTFSSRCLDVPEIPFVTLTRLSSAGLVYKHFGLSILDQLYPSLASHDKLDLYHRLYLVLIEEFDAIDNGINPTTEVPKFITGTSSIFSQIERLNSIDGLSPKDAEEEFRQFKKGMQLCKTLFLDVLNNLVFCWLPAKEIVYESVLAHDGPIVVMKTSCAWKDHLFSVERTLFKGKNSPLLYVLYPKEGTAMWMAQTIPLSPGSFESRLPFPEPWRGLRDAELDTVTGIPGGVFVHASGFLAGAASFEVAKKLISLSIFLQSQ